MPSSLVEDPERSKRVVVEENEFTARARERLKGAARADEAIKGVKDVLQTLAEHGMAVQGSPDLYGWVLTLEGKTYRVFYKFDDTTVYLLGLGPAISSTFQ